MEAIKRQIFVLRDTLKDTIDYNLGTDMVPIEYHIMDFSVPATAAAVVYVLKSDGELDKILADVLDNVISFRPTKGFFTEGLNAIRVRIVNDNKALVSFTETVRVGKNMKFDDDTETQQKTLIEQLLTKMGESDGNMKIERAERIAGDENEKAERKAEIDVERQRINNLAKLQEGSTTGDAELADIRTGADGKIYENAGEAVRGQVTALKEDLSDLYDMYFYVGEMINGMYIHSVTGLPTEDSSSSCTDFIDVSSRINNKIKFKNIFVRGSRSVAAYNYNKKFLYCLKTETTNTEFECELSVDVCFVRCTSVANHTPTIKQYSAIKKMKKVYVDGINGSDLNNGTKYFPFKTIQKAIDSGAKNIYITQGEYNESVRLINKENITIMPFFYGSYTNAVDTPLIKISGKDVPIESGILIKNCSNINLIDLWVDNTTLHGFDITNCVNLNVLHCYCSNTRRDGFKIVNVTGKFENCKTWNIGDNIVEHADGYNIHGYGDTQFINCIAHDCQDDGISHHDACTGTIIGGEYYNCKKGGVASPTHGAQVNVYNVRTHHNAYGIYTALESGKTPKDSIIANNLIHDNTVAGISANGYNLTGYNNIFRNNGKPSESINNGVYSNYENNQ